MAKSIALYIVGLGILGCGSTTSHPDSIPQALRNRPDEFPPPYLVVVPPRAGSVLGETLSSDNLAAGRAVASDQACFLTTPHSTPSLVSEVIEYKASKELKADLSKIGADVSAHIKDDATAKLNLKKLSIVTSIGIPNFDGCTFDDGDAQKSTVTSEIVADEAAFDYTSAFDAGAKVDASKLGKLEAGWVSTENGKLTGEKILLGAKQSSVRVEVGTATVNFPTSSQAELPLGFGGQLAVVGYSAAAQQVDLLLTVNGNKDNPTNIPSCKVAPEHQKLGNGEACLLMLGGTASDNAGLFVRWAAVGGNATISAKGFRVKLLSTNH